MPAIHLILNLQGYNFILNLHNLFLFGLETLSNLKTELEVFRNAVLSAGSGI
jgi:hypothetical protein